MLRTILPMLLAVALVAGEDPTIVVHGPTVVAFFAPIKHPETEGDELQALAHFKANAKQVRETLEKSGVELDEVYAVGFEVRNGAKVETFDSGHMKVGYYFVAPEKKPRIEYGIAAPAQLLQVAREYFGIAIH
jgi:hypothetical protein